MAKNKTKESTNESVIAALDGSSDDSFLLGKVCRDYVSGFVGICTSILLNMDGTSLFYLTAKARNNTHPCTIAIGEDRVERFKATKQKTKSVKVKAK